ncbi:MAG: hypothetical protein NPIRA06_03080 [Nitrospirales bacterium]|nr:MAG: hypothetical protein NPIRA06_03080 [Nitrospirales bacterium]
MSENLLTIPKDAAQKIIASSAIIACPILGTNNFIKFCRDRDLNINRERLFRLERLELFSPIFRVKTPEKDSPSFAIPLVENNNWFVKGWAWDTTDIKQKYSVPDHKDHAQEGYYSIFQIDHLSLVLSAMSLDVHMDDFLDKGKQHEIDWEKKGRRWIELFQSQGESLATHEYRRSTALLCQFISNRYYPQTQTDQRTIKTGGRFYSDQWITVLKKNYDWDEAVRIWQPHSAEELFDLTPEKLKHAYEGLSIAQSSCDPLDSWYQLVQFISVNERQKLKGQALRAETIRAGANMLRLLYKDLYSEELPNPNEITRTIITHIPELEVRKDTRRYLEFVVNQYKLNPQPSLCLLVEGKTEELAVTKIFEEYFSAHPGTYGIEIINLRGVDNATGGKKEQYQAIIRLIDYLHHHQTFAFLILDNEGYAGNLQKRAKKAKSIHQHRLFVTRPEYIKIWGISFEFDNYSCQEIATALNKIVCGKALFSGKDIMACKKDQYPGASLEKLFEEKIQRSLPKVQFNEILLETMFSETSRRKISNRPIIKILERAAKLAARNPLPTMNEIWVKNQASKYLGKKG